MFNRDPPASKIIMKGRSNEMQHRINGVRKDTAGNLTQHGRRCSEG